MSLSSLFKRKTPEDEAGAAGAAFKPARRGKAASASASASASGSASASAGVGASPGAGASIGTPTHESAAVVQARTQARRRLMGAAVLLLLGVVLFSFIFETQPRSLPMDLPMAVAPGKGIAGPVAAPAPQPVQAGQPVQAVTPATRPAPPIITETAAEAGTLRKVETPTSEPAAVPNPPVAPTMAPAAATSPPSAQASAPVPTPAPAVAPKPATAKASAPSAAAVAAAPAAPAASTGAGRFVVQVGAFADEATIRQTRQKVEKLGLKTYTQEVNTEAGKRVRVRVGPFAEREEAAKVLQKLKGAGLPGAVLAL